MIKKLNSNKRINRQIGLTECYYKSGDFTKISILLHGIKFELTGLKAQINLYELRLRYVIAHEKSKKVKVELKFQHRILKEHLKSIEKLKQDNAEAIHMHYSKKFGDDVPWWNY